MFLCSENEEAFLLLHFSYLSNYLQWQVNKPKTFTEEKFILRHMWWNILYSTCFSAPKHLNTLSLAWHILSLCKVTALPSLLTVFTLCSCGRRRTMSLSLQMVFHWLTVALIEATWPWLAQKGLLFLHKSQGVTLQKDKELHFVIDFWAQIPQNKKRGGKKLSEISLLSEERREKRWKGPPIDLEVNSATNTTKTLSNLKCCRKQALLLFL